MQRNVLGVPHRKSEERLVSRKELSERWGVSTETIKRRTQEGLLKPLRFNQRLLRYRLSDILRIEHEAGAKL
jgi:predicted site-specific integrase-resolvase